MKAVKPKAISEGPQRSPCSWEESHFSSLAEVSFPSFSFCFCIRVRVDAKKKTNKTQTKNEIQLFSSELLPTWLFIVKICNSTRHRRTWLKTNPSFKNEHLIPSCFSNSCSISHILRNSLHSVLVASVPSLCRFPSWGRADGPRHMGVSSRRQADAGGWAAPASQRRPAQEMPFPPVTRTNTTGPETQHPFFTSAARKRCSVLPALK